MKSASKPKSKNAITAAANRARKRPRLGSIPIVLYADRPIGPQLKVYRRKYCFSGSEFAALIGMHDANLYAFEALIGPYKEQTEFIFGLPAVKYLAALHADPVLVYLSSPKP